MKKHRHFGKKIVSIIMAMLCMLTAFSAVACTPKNETDTSKVNISLLGSTDGYGVRGLKLQAQRFNDAFKNKVYTDPVTGETKTGAVMTIYETDSTGSPTASWAQDPYTIYRANIRYTAVDNAFYNNYIANIDDIMRATIPGENKSIVDKIPEEIRYAYSAKDKDGKEVYLGFPWVEQPGGLIYDVELWDTGYYLAAPSATDYTPFNSIIFDGQTFKFVDKDGEKSVGPNGVPGDYDDGLPSSMIEFIAVCEYLKNEGGIAPFSYPYEYPYYHNLGIEALMFSLLGVEHASTMYDLESENATFNVVTGFTEENLFSDNVSSNVDAKVPVVQQVKVEESSGYYTSMSLEKYWCYALVDLADSEGWYSKSTEAGDHRQTQYNFIFGIEPAYSDKRAATISEGSYWFNESLDSGNFSDYEKTFGKKADDRNIAWMPLPVNIYTSVTGEDKVVTVNGVTESTKGEIPTIDALGETALLVNKNVEGDAMVMEAIKDYYLFVTSDVELNQFAADTGYTAMLDFEYLDSVMDEAPKYVQETFKLFNSSNRIRTFSQTKTVREQGDPFIFARGNTSYYFLPDQSSNNRSSRAFIAPSAYKAFTQKITEFEDWWAIYIGEGEHATPTRYNNIEFVGKKWQNGSWVD